MSNLIADTTAQDGELSHAIILASKRIFWGLALVALALVVVTLALVVGEAALTSREVHYALMAVIVGAYVVAQNR
ncbi:MAG: hypothetical protein ACFB2Z_05015 [Maricaulaceae bacterium]